MKAQLFFMIAFFPARVMAADSGSSGLFFPGLRLIAGMAVIIGLMLLVYIVNRKGITFLKRGGTNRINIMETRPVGGRKVLCLVEVRGQELLLGLGNERIDFLCRLGDAREGDDFESSLQSCFQEKE